MRSTEEAARAMEETKKNGRKKGGLRTMPFIFANEVAEKLAVVGFQSNMLTYLTQQLHLPLAKAATTLTNFGGTSAGTPLIGAFHADAYVGRFWTIAAALIVRVCSSLSSIHLRAGKKTKCISISVCVYVWQGMALLTLSAALPQFRPPPCKPGGAASCQEAAPWQLAVLYVSLLLNAVGAGGYRPCMVAFGGDQFDESRAAERARSWGFFNWYYFGNGASMLLAVTAVVYVQDNVGWGWGLGVPTACMGVSVAAFVAGYPMYRRFEPPGSPFTRLAQVVVAAFRKRRVPVSADVDAARLYENDDMDKPISIYGKLLHTDQLSFFDRAAVVTDGDLVTPTDGEPIPNPWRLSTVHRVEELKSVIRTGPIWAAGILVVTASSNQGTFSLQQASTMDRRLFPGLSSFQIPAGSMTVFSLLAMLVTLFFYDRALVPLMRRRTGLDRGITYLQRMGVGFAVCAASTLVAGFVESRRRDAAAAAGTTDVGTAPTMSAYWLVPQYALQGVAEAFNSVGHLEFMYDQSPESMRSTATALFWLSISLGSYASTALVAAVHRWSAGADGSNWLPDNINHGRLDYFYWVVTMLQVLNLVYYIICAKRFTFKPVQFHKKEEEEEGGKSLVELQEKV
ncbi:hypothetical protein EJB05_45329 [Eragrostis curvula]|uniref:Major facilitator superfamily (MFS) profile domain-containing protein n=1 Tax=Eragrostis curvula TaxID=38414 RepID=A0A5J9TKM4_9POAL|nr:hypothetical protein EJB05_45329 [Eragrostis curvula]